MLSPAWKDSIEKRYNTTFLDIVNHKMHFEPASFNLAKQKNNIEITKITNENQSIKFTLKSPYTYTKCEVNLLDCWGIPIHSYPINNINKGVNEYVVKTEGNVNPEGYYITIKSDDSIIGATKYMFTR